MFSFLGLEEYMTYYQARSSICTKGPVRDFIDTEWVDNLDSPFQRRMVKMDIKRIPIPFNEIDILIIDLIDERFNVLNFENSLITGSIQYFDAGGGEIMTNQIAFKPGSENHLQAFRKGCRILSDWVREHQVPVIFHQARWAKNYNDNGSIFPFEKQGLIAGSNKRLGLMESILIEEINPIVILKSKPELILGDTSHKWGIANFHYIIDYYEDIWRQIRQAEEIILNSVKPENRKT